METPLLSVIVPTVGRPSLARTVRSLLKQGEWLPWEAVLVGDTHAGTWAEQLPLARALAAQHPERLRYVEHDGGLHAWGHPQRNYGATVARGRWLAWLGDDDVYLPGAFETLGRALRRQEDDPRVLLFRWIAPWKQVLWHTAGALLEGLADAECIVCPNEADRLGTWNSARYQGDFDFITETAGKWGGPERVIWQPEVIAQAQPTEGEDWTLGGREAPPLPARIEVRGVAVPVVAVRLNLGCGAYHLAGFENWDDDPDVPCDRRQRVPPIPLPEASVDEIYMGHFLEHVDPEAIGRLLRECRRVLVPGGRLGVVVPDTRKVLEHYLRQDGATVEVPEGVHWRLNDLDSVCAVFLYSTIQTSPHRWSYDRATLCRVLERAGFRLGASIDPYSDPRLSTPQWYNLGQDCFKPEAPA